ncbi:MAG TPA: hypothetical protein VLB86_06430 [Gaiellaceae bacterium]|nr:hypothetical protein [Gaiellaceae bacterium]
MLHADQDTRLLLAREHHVALRQDARRAGAGRRRANVLETRRRTYALREWLRVWTRQGHRPASSAT